MAQFEGATSSAVAAYWRAINAGADREVALEVALARLRAMYPGQDEWSLRSWLAKGLAAARVGAPAGGAPLPEQDGRPEKRN